MRAVIPGREHLKQLVNLFAAACLLLVFFFGSNDRFWEAFFLLILVSLSAIRRWKPPSGSWNPEKAFL